MNTNSAVLSPQIKGRSRPFRSLLVAVAGALILTGFIVPKADAAFVVAYFNFEDSNTPGFIDAAGVDITPDLQIGLVQIGGFGLTGDNPGGGIEPTISNLSISTTGSESVTSGLLLNRTSGDSDTADPGFAINFSRSGSGHTATIQFSVNLAFYQGLSLSFATNNNGNGYQDVTLSWSGGGTTPGSITQAIPPSPGEIITFDLTSFTTLNGNGNFKFVTFTLTFTNGQSNGQDLQTVVDNIVLSANVVIPEPATVMGGLLGVFGLFWHQRRRLARFLRLRPA
jgi:hypothetical protein